MTTVVRFITRVAAVLAALLAAPAALAVDSGDIVVVSVKGEVQITLNGTPRVLAAGGVIEPPASLRTGADGAIELRQGATTVSVGPETLLEFPALEKRGAPIDRIVQSRGNAFYNVGKREGRKLRVETPYLVGVIKGTQFNVAVGTDGATISLFEGLLDVRAADGSGAVDLRAGEIASRKRGEASVSVMKMEGSKPSSTGSRGSSGSPASAVAANPNAPAAIANSSVDFGSEIAADLGPGRIAGPVAAGIGVTTVVDSGPASVTTTAASTFESGPLTTETGVTVAANPVAGTAGATIDAGVTAPLAQVDTGASVAVNVAAGTVDLGATVAGVDTSLGVDLGLDDGNNGHGNDSNSSDASNPGHGSDNKDPGNSDVTEVLEGLLHHSRKK